MRRLKRFIRRRSQGNSRKASLRWLCITLSVGFGVGLLLWGNWRWQQRRTAQTMRKQGDAFAVAGEWSKAALRYEHYVALFPEESAVQSALAHAIDQTADDDSARLKAAKQYQAVLRRTSALLPQERCRLAELWLSLGRDRAAQAELDRVLAVRPRDPQALRIRALSLYREVVSGQREPSNAITSALKLAWELNPPEATLALSWATWLREWAPLRSAQQADQTMAMLVACAPKDASAWLGRYSYRLKYGLADAGADLAYARELAPDDRDVLLAVGDLALRQGHAKRAQTAFQRAIEKDAADRRGYLGLALCAERLGERETAILACRQGLAAVGRRDPWLALRLAECLVDTPDSHEVPALLEGVEQRMRQSQAAQLPEARRGWRHAIELVRGRWHLSRQEFEEASSIFDQLFDDGSEGLSATDPLRLKVELAYLRAVCFAGMRKWHDMATAFETAWRMEPGTADHLLAAGKAWERACRWERAASCYERAAGIASDPTTARRLLAQIETRNQAPVPVATP